MNIGSCCLRLQQAVWLSALWLVAIHPRLLCGQSPDADLPDAPRPQPLVAMFEFQASQSDQSTKPGFPPVSTTVRPQPSGSPRQNPGIPSQQTPCPADMASMSMAMQATNMSCAPHFNPYQRFLNSSGPHPLTVKQKGLLAVRNVTDPFNFLTIAGESALSVASDAHSPYGPGYGGFGYSVGVAYTETVVGNFFGTFLIPAVTHQDPHYHREPNAPIARRLFHTAAAVVWAQSDAGTGMPNYANLGTTAIADALGDLYVPGAQQGFGAGISRYFTSIATDPIDNVITEFLPDVAKRINVKIVLVQRVVYEVERQNGAS